MHVDVNDAKKQLSQLIRRVLAGEEVIIDKNGKPRARLVPYRQPGSWKGKIWISPDFDKADEEIEKMFNGDDDNATT
ncbi:MAG TPA: type II toxin-antitoxin system prevent-host-death family antitoxin [Bryobacteraceae bacterium]|nr:type II toxin-antitoxin system prevent-host-death family antitoxin [Bryobacteraceae bacterium]